MTMSLTLLSSLNRNTYYFTMSFVEETIGHGLASQRHTGNDNNDNIYTSILHGQQQQRWQCECKSFSQNRKRTKLVKDKRRARTKPRKKEAKNIEPMAKKKKFHRSLLLLLRFLAQFENDICEYMYRWKSICATRTTISLDVCEYCIEETVILLFSYVHKIIN